MNLTFDQYISVFSSLATWVTAIVVLLTLLEMARQRKNSFKPDIVPVEQLIYAGQSPIHSYPAPTMWLDRKISESEEDIRPLKNYEVALYNVGNGAAKDISIKWTFDIDSFIEKINKLSQRTFAGQYLEVTDKGWLSFKTQNSGSAMINTNIDLSDKKDYILPSSVDKHGVRCKLPFSYITLVSSYVQLVAQKESEKELNAFEIPAAKAIIFYSDIGGNRFESSFTFTVDIVMFSQVTKDAITTFHGILKVKSS